MSATNIDWDLIQKLDPVQIKQNKDSKSIHTIIKSINSCFISSDQTIFSNNPLTPKLIQLLQISIQYLLSFQKHLSSTIENKKNDIVLLKKKYKKLDQAYHQLTVINENLRKPREVCPTCGKKFKIGYLDRHFQLRHPELMEPWTKIRSKSSINNHPKADKAIIDEISAIQKAKERSKLEINKGNTVQISPNKENKQDKKKPNSQNDEQISLNQGQLEQMVDEISKRISEKIQIEKNSNSENIENYKSSRNNKNPQIQQKSNSENIENYKSSQNNKNSQIQQKSNSVPSQKLQQYALDARRHDQSLNHQHYIQQNTTNEFTENEYKENQNISANSLKKYSGNRVVFDPSVIENNRDSKRRNASLNEVNDYDDYEYNDDYNNEDNYNYNYSNSPMQNIISQSANSSVQKNDEISANELDDFIMGSSDVAMSNHQAKQVQQKVQPNTQKYNKNDSYSKNKNELQNEFDEFMVDSSEIAASNRQKNVIPKNQSNQQRQNQTEKYKINNTVNQNNEDFRDEFDDFMIGSEEQNQAQFSQKVKMQQQQKPPQQQKIQQQQQKPQQQQQQKIQQQQQQKPQQFQQKQQQIKQQPQQQKLQQQKQQQIKPQQQQQKLQNIQNQQQIKQQPQRSKQQNNQDSHQFSASPQKAADNFNNEFDDFMIEDDSISNRPTAKKSTPTKPKNVEGSPSSLPPSPAAFSSASFPPSPKIPQPTRRSDNENSAFEFTDGSPRPTGTATSSSFRRSFNDEEAEEFKDFMMPPDELPKPPKRDIQGSYVAITNDELDDLIKESSSILDEEKSKNDSTKPKSMGSKKPTKPLPSKQKKLTNSEIDALINDGNNKNKSKNFYDDNQDFYNDQKNNKLPPQFANYSPSELEVILAEDSSAMENAKLKNKNDVDDYYYQDNKNNYDNFNDDYYDNQPNENNYNDKYYNDDFNDGAKAFDNFSNKNYKADDYFNDEKTDSHQNLQEKINKPPMSIAEARKMAKKKKKSQITTIGGVEFTDSQLAGFL